ncbi:MAG TPA: hypothetical protein IAA29_12055 [Candidatus Paenibacillus intestinavium]|nr:hypothetical protein [Candidatus Paenibacillus intestinavium]
MRIERKRCPKRLEGWKRLHALNRFRRSKSIIEGASDWIDKEIFDIENWLMGRTVKPVIQKSQQLSELPSTAQLNLDGQDLITISTALAEKANLKISNGDPYEGERLLNLALKVRNAREEFHAKHYAAFAKKYALKEEEPSCKKAQLG